MPFHAHKPARGACRQCESAIEITTMIAFTSECYPQFPFPIPTTSASLFARADLSIFVHLMVM